MIHTLVDLGLILTSVSILVSLGIETFYRKCRRSEYDEIKSIFDDVIVTSIGIMAFAIMFKVIL